MSETLDSILSGQRETAPAPETTPAVVSTDPKPESQPRQPDGKFATKPTVEPTATPATTPAPAKTTPPPQAAATPASEPTLATPAVVPRGAMEAERAKRQERDAQIAELEGRIAQLTAFVQQPRTPPPPPAPPPDPFADPEGYAQHVTREAITPIERAMEEQRHEFSRVMAEEKHGPETVQSALQAIVVARNTPQGEAEFQRIMKARLPYQELVTWHKRQSALSEIGEDPAAYKARIRAELLAEMQGTNGAQPAVPAAPATPAPVMPSNLSGARNVGTRSGPAWEGPKSLQDIFSRPNRR